METTTKKTVVTFIGIGLPVLGATIPYMLSKKNKVFAALTGGLLGLGLFGLILTGLDKK